MTVLSSAKDLKLQKFNVLGGTRVNRRCSHTSGRVQCSGRVNSGSVREDCGASRRTVGRDGRERCSTGRGRLPVDREVRKGKA